MFDIDRELSALGRIKHRPDDTLRRRTLDRLRGYTHPAKPKRSPLLRWYATVAAIAVALAVLFVMLPGAQATSYYTIDINPSIGMETDSAGIVLSVTAQNEDAESMLIDLDLRGMFFLDAFRVIVQTAESEGYLKDNGHVLVAHFGTTAAVSEAEIEAIVQESTHTEVSVLLLQSEKSDYEDARQQRQSAGITLLMRDAQRLGIDDADVDTMIKAVKRDEHQGHGNSPSQTNPTSSPNDTRPPATTGNNSEEPEVTDNGSTATVPEQNEHGNGSNNGNGNSGNSSGSNNGHGNSGNSNGSDSGHGNGQSDKGDNSKD